jgi:hypothetical protein
MRDTQLALHDSAPNSIYPCARWPRSDLWIVARDERHYGMRLEGLQIRSLLLAPRPAVQAIVQSTRPTQFALPSYRGLQIAFVESVYSTQHKQTLSHRTPRPLAVPLAETTFRGT